MFEVRLTRQAQKYLQKAPEKIKQLFKSCFEKLEKDPFRIVEPLYGPLKEKWKLKLGNLRLIMEICLETKRIKVFYIGPRGDVYKKKG